MASCLRRLKLNRIRDIEPQPPVLRYEHEQPGDLLNFDIKRLVKIEKPSHRVTGDRRDTVRGIGAEFLQIAIDDHSRIAFTTMYSEYPDQKEASAPHFLYSAVAWFAQLGIGIRRVLTDNCACYKARHFRDTCQNLGIKPKRTTPHTPHTNGKAERFIQTALREWAYAKLKQLPPITRADLDANNPLRLHI